MCCNLKETINNIMGFKVSSDSRKNRIDSNMIQKIINELTEVHNLIVDNQMFIAGFKLGRLQGDLVFLMEQMEEREKTGDRLAWLNDIRSK